MKKSIVFSLLLVGIILPMQAQITRMSMSELYEGNTYVGFLGRGGLGTGGWAEIPNALTLTYAARDFAIGGWRKSDGLWGGARLFINSDDGNVGIGTTSPSAKLEILGSSQAGNEIGSFKLKSTTANQFMYFGYDDRYSAGYIQSVKPGTNQQNILIAPAGGNVGIGTTSPSTKLEILGSSQTENEIGSFKLKSATANQFMYFGYDDRYSAGYIQSVKPGTNQQNILLAPSGGNVGIGTSTPDTKLTVNGTIHAKEVKVDLSIPAPDYVFANGYKLKTLPEVEAYINKNSHLPEIPSAKEIEKNGLMLAEMNMNLLKKVEELTLYMIEQSKKIEKQNEKIILLEKKVNTIESTTK